MFTAGTLRRVYRSALGLLGPPLLIAGCGGGGSNGPGAVGALTYANPQVYTLGTAIAPLSPTVAGTVSSYRAAPALPVGLTINATSGLISGTPTSAQPSMGYTITAANASGSARFVLSISVITVRASPASISRMVVASTSARVALAVTPVDFTFSVNFAATATDADGVFMPMVSSVANGSGYSLTLTTSPRAPPGHYTGAVIVKLCSGPSCATVEPVSSVSIPYDVYVLSGSSTWPGNNLTVLAPWSDVPEWTMFQGNAAHTGYVPVALDPNTFSTRWQIPAIDIPVAYPANLNTLTSSNQQLFIGGGTTLYARKEIDGSIVWQYDFSGLANPSVNPPSVASGVVYVAAGQQQSTYFFAFDATDGSLVFKSPMISQWENYLAPTIGPDGIYTDSGEYGGMYGFNTSGQQLFFAGLPQISQWTPAVDANAVYTYLGGALSVLDPPTGTVLTTITDPTYQQYQDQLNGSPVLGAAGSVFAANYANSVINGGSIGNTLIDFDVPSASIAWKIAGNYPNTPAYNAGVLYAVNDDPVQVEARSEADGSLLWSWVPPQAAETGFVSEPLLTQNLVFVSTNLATYAIDLATHQAVWSYPLVGKLALSKSGIMYIEGQQSQSTPAVPGSLTAINVK